MQSLPVNEADLPLVSTKPTWRSSRPGSRASSRSRTVPAESPRPINSRPRGPKDVLAEAWVATAPTLALVQGTTAPTAGNLDATATPQAWALRSQATIEKVASLCIGVLWSRREKGG